MKKLLPVILFLSFPWSVMAEPPSKSNPGKPFASVLQGLERNYQATQDIPGVIIDNLRDLIPPPKVGSQRWISPNWEQSQTSQSGSAFTTRTRVFIFNPDRLYSVAVNVRAYLPDGSEFTSGLGSTVPANLLIPPFGQAKLTIQDFTGETHRGVVVIEADGPVFPDGSIIRQELGTDDSYSRTMVWYPDNSSDGDQRDSQDTIP